MDFEEYRRSFGYRPRDLRRFLERDLIKGAERLSGGGWFIPSGVRPDYLIRKKANRTVEDDAYDYLKALKMHRAIRADILLCTEAEYQDLHDLLLAAGMIARSGREHGEGEHVITQKGIELLSRKKGAFLEAFGMILSSISEGAVSATLEHGL